MKLGNTSQSLVPVPDFFLNQTLKQMETFEVSERKRYYREKDLFRMTNDINLCNNPRNFHRKHEIFNKQKYIPDLTNINGVLKNYNNSNNSKFLNSIVSPKANTYENFSNFFEKTNVTNFTNPGLREEIHTNINVLINKINDKYDLDKWAATDTRKNLMQTNSENYFNTKNNFNYTNDFSPKNFLRTKRDEYLNLTDERKFKTILRDKVNIMSIDGMLKSKLVKNFDKFGEFTSDKFYKTKAFNLIEKLESDKNQKNSNSNKNVNDNYYKYYNDNSQEKLMQEISFSKVEKIKLTKSSTNLKFYNSNNLNKKNKKLFNNTSKDYNTSKIIDTNDNFNLGKITVPMVTAKYSIVNSDFYGNLSEVQKLRKNNEKIYDRFKSSNLFKDFPSPDRKEFVLKKGEKLRMKTKNDKVDRNLTNFSNYNASKHKSVFCEDYDTNEAFMVNFKQSKDIF